MIYSAFFPIVFKHFPVKDRRWSKKLHKFMHLDKEDPFHIFWFYFFMYFFFWNCFQFGSSSLKSMKVALQKEIVFWIDNTRMKRFPWTERVRKNVGTVDNRCQFCDFLSNSSLTHLIVLIKLNNPLSFPDSGSVKTLVFSCFAGLLKEAHEQTITEEQGQSSRSIIGGSEF